VNKSPGMLLVSGSDMTRSASLNVSIGFAVSPITSATAAEKPIERTTARAVTIQVDRTERSLVHSDTSVVPKPGCLVVVIPCVGAVDAVILVNPFGRELAGGELMVRSVSGRSAPGTIFDAVARQLHEGLFQARLLG
jgi:hypothetical protein